MRILHVCYFPPDGLTSLEALVSRTLEDLGHEVHTAVLFAAAGRGPREHGLGATAADRKGRRGRGRLARRVRSFVAEQPYDTFVVHRYRTLEIVSRAIPALARGVWLVHGRGVLARPLRSAYVRKRLEPPWRLAAVSQAVVDDLEGRGIPPGAARVLHNAVDLAALRPALRSRAEARAQLGLDTNAFLFGAVGRLVPKKGFDLLLEALAAADPEAHVAILGAGRERDALAAQAQRLGLGSRVDLTGAVEDAVRVMPAFDALVVPSRDEGFGLTALEGLAAGVPVVASDDGGLPDVLGPCGQIFRAGDARDLAAALRAVRALPADVRADQIRRGRERVAAQFDRPRYRSDWAELLADWA